MKGEDGSEVFEDGVVLARQFLGKGAWLVWDLRVDGEVLPAMFLRLRKARMP